MVTREKLISDLEIRLTKSKPSDDFEFEYDQAAHLLDINRDELIVTYLNDKIKKEFGVDPRFIESQQCTSPDLEDSCFDDCLKRMTLTLENRPLSLTRDMGIVRVITRDGAHFHKIRHNDLDIIKDLPFAKPSQTTLSYYREGDLTIILQGISHQDIEIEDITVYYVPSYENTPPQDDELYKLPDELIPFLLERVEEIFRKQFYNSSEDLGNDGQQEIG